MGEMTITGYKELGAEWQMLWNKYLEKREKHSIFVNLDRRYSSYDILFAGSLVSLRWDKENKMLPLPTPPPFFSLEKVLLSSASNLNAVIIPISFSIIVIVVNCYNCFSY